MRARDPSCRQQACIGMWKEWNVTRIEPGPDAPIDIDLRIRLKCITCGNSRVFYVLQEGHSFLWEAHKPMPEGARVQACGRCRSRNSLMRDYAD